MTNLKDSFCFKVRECRREAGISQSALAKEVGCKQSALSMFEIGDGTKLSDETVKKLAERFSLQKLLEESIIEKASSDITSSPGSKILSDTSHIRSHGFCPNPHCPSHIHYEIDGVSFLKPNLEEQDPVYARFCAVCGEILERACPNCGKPIHSGAVCSFCGTKYICV